jgi:hypothetical protein
MVNYLNILDIQNIIENEYISRFDDNTEKLTAESKINKKN